MHYSYNCTESMIEQLPYGTIRTYDILRSREQNIFLNSSVRYGTLESRIFLRYVRYNTMIENIVIPGTLYRTGRENRSWYRYKQNLLPIILHIRYRTVRSKYNNVNRIGKPFIIKSTVVPRRTVPYHTVPYWSTSINFFSGHQRKNDDVFISMLPYGTGTVQLILYRNHNF